MNKYMACSKLKTVRFEALNMREALKYIEYHYGTAFEWLIAKI